jgi:hypothetical protein
VSVRECMDCHAINPTQAGRNTSQADYVGNLLG